MMLTGLLLLLQYKSKEMLRIYLKLQTNFF